MRLGHAAHRPLPFFWQGLLMVLPLAVLAGVGVISLRNDRALARHEATQRAQAVAAELLDGVVKELLPAREPRITDRVLKVDGSGKLVQPAPMSPVPEPRLLDEGRLTREQLRLWKKARAESRNDSESGSGSREAAWAALLDSAPPGEFCAAALYSLGLLLEGRGDDSGAARQFERLLERFPEVPGESGLILGHLAQLKLLEIDPREPGRTNRSASPTFETFCSNVVARPTLVTPLLLERGTAAARNPADTELCRTWQRIWQQHELGRAIYQAAQPAIAGGARFAWVRIPEPVSVTISNPGVVAPPVEIKVQDWLLARPDADTNGIYWFFHEAEVGGWLTALAARPGRVPVYSVVELAVGGRVVEKAAPDRHRWREVGYFGRRGGGLRKEVLEDSPTDELARAVLPGAKAGRPEVTVYLANAGALFKAQRARTFWFGALISTAAVVAFAGYVATWRAFQRQLQLSEMKSNFVSSVSHELRAPIASVRLMAESLERGKVPEETRRQEYFRFISQECRRLSSLIENVLDFSRIDQGQKRYEKEPVDVQALMEHTVQVLRPYAAERGVSLEIAPVSAGECQIVADGKALQQALVNLLDNAIKHSRRGQTVTVGLEHATATNAEATQQSRSCAQGQAAGAGVQPESPPPSRPQVSLWVEDHGQGIPAAEQERIFERFYRLGSELRRETTGVGIGLSIVKHVVEGHGGRVIVRSAPGAGSRFTIELPAGAPGSQPCE